MKSYSKNCLAWVVISEFFSESLINARLYKLVEKQMIVVIEDD